MDLMQAFEQVCGEFPQFRAQLAAARDLTSDAGVRAQLDEVLTSLDQSFAQFKETFPRAAGEVKETLANAQAKAESASAALAAAEQQRAEAAAALQAAAAAAPPAPAVPAIAPLDPNLAVQLRQELLERFTGWRRRPDGQKRVDREIWEDWDEN